MSINLSKSTFVASLLSIALLHGALPAQAGDHALWRDQVKQQETRAFALESGKSGPVLNDSKLWREQIPTGRSESVTRRVATTRTQASPPIYLLWREQIKSPPAEISSSATASR